MKADPLADTNPKRRNGKELTESARKAIASGKGHRAFLKAKPKKK